jgi:hypothetical protein
VPRAPRLIVPPLDPAAAEAEPAIPFQPQEFPDTPEPDAELDDILQLAQAAYADWGWYVYRYKSTDEMLRDPRAKIRALVTRIDGPLDIMDIQNRFGGGRYEFWGFHGGTLQKRKTIELEGPRKSYDPPPGAAPAPAPLPAAPAAPMNDERVVRLIEELTRRVDKLSADNEPQGVGISVKDMIALMDLMQSRNTQPPGPSVVKEMVDAVKMGIELGGEAQGGGKRGNLEVILEKLSPVLEKVATAMVTQRPRAMMRPGGPPAGTPIEAPARVVNEPEPQELDMDQVRMTAAVDALSRAITAGMEPADFASSLADILSPEQLHLLKALPEEQVVSTLLSIAPGHYPVLLADSSKLYIGAVLTELKSESSEG